MKILDSQIIYTFSTSFEGPILDSEILSKIFLKSGITRIVYNNSGKYFYSEKDKIHKKDVNIKMNQNQTRMHFNLEGWPKDEYSKELLFQNHINTFFERKFFSIESNRINYKYIRFSSEPIYLLNKDGKLLLYPTFYMYDSGIIILELRRIIDYEVELGNFIDHFVNASFIEFDKCYGNIAVAEILKGISKTTNALEDLSIDTTDFKFDLKEMIFDNNLSIGKIALNLFKVIISIFNSILENHKKLKKIRYSIGQFWSGKPHIHIIKFSEQKRKSSKNYKLYSNEFRKILFRANHNIKDTIEQVELKDLRPFDDYSCFMNSAVYLYVWSTSGIILNKEFNLNNNNGSVFSNQIISRFLDYYQMLFERALKVIEDTDDLQEIIRYQKDVYALKSDTFHNFKHGEHRDIFNFAIKELNLDSFENNLMNILELKRAESEQKRNRKIVKIGFLLTILFGLFSSGTLAKDLIIPIYLQFFNLPFISNDHNSIFFWVLTSVIISSTVLLGFKIIDRK